MFQGTWTTHPLLVVRTRTTDTTGMLLTEVLMMMEQPTKRAIALLGAAALLATTSCGVPFDPYWRVEKFRVLGVKADPITVRPGEVATLSALAVSPDGADVTYAWSWCPFQTSPSNEYECPFTRDELVELLTEQIPEEQRDQLPPGFDIGTLLPEFDLGTGETGSLPYPGSPELVLFFCQLSEQVLAAQNEAIGGEAGVSQCDRGFDVTVRGIFESGGSKIVAAKQVKLWTGSDLYANKNPDVQEIQIRLKNSTDEDIYGDEMPWVSEVDTAGWYTLPADSVTPLKANLEYEVRSLVDPELVEVFQRVAPVGSDDEDGLTDPEPESVTYRWFVSEGDIGDSERLYKEGVSPESLEDTSITDFQIPYDADPEAPQFPEQATDWDRDGVDNDDDPCPWVSFETSNECEAAVWSVVRDGRLGMDWVERRIKVLPPPG